ncbi:MAG: glycosyltransferase family 9 protein [Bryobacterales bacterium]|nr:glycosyltransferase family 9 protein [Acidobacteriota bacterium]MCB9383298.1 glycosyltransferase family 9 protein [Bryobacterales bacterium]
MKVLQQLSHGATAAVVRLRSLGDTVLITPALQLLRRARPDLWIVVLLDRALVPLLEGSPDVDQVVAVDAHGKRDLIRFVRSLEPELCLNLHGGSTSAWITALSGAKFRAGYAHYSKRFLYNVRIPRAQQILGRPADAPVHTAEHHASAIFHLGAEMGPIPAARLQAKPRPAQREPYAIFHVAAAYDTKRWSEERFLATARHVRDRHGLSPLILAGPGQDKALEAFREFERLPQLSIPAMKTFVENASLFVGNDSGPAHVAAAFSVPSVVIFGSSDSRVWGPWGGTGEAVETAWDCKPCPGDKCRAFGEPRCILTVTPEAVQAAIERALAR